MAQYRTKFNAFLDEETMMAEYALSVGQGVMFMGTDDIELLEAIVSWYKENLGTLHAITFNYREDGETCWAIAWYEK